MKTQLLAIVDEAIGSVETGDSEFSCNAIFIAAKHAADSWEFGQAMETRYASTFMPATRLAKPRFGSDGGAWLTSTTHGDGYGLLQGSVEAKEQRLWMLSLFRAMVEHGDVRMTVEPL